MAKYYTLKPNRIVIKPLAFLAPIGLVVIILLLFSPILMLLIFVKGNLQELDAESFGSYILVAPMLLACIPFFTYSRRQLIFEGTEGLIYLHTLFGKKTLMSFADVEEIRLKPSIGMAYYLWSKDDRYGKGHRISPSFSNEKDKDKAEYESIVLVAIKNLLKEKTINTPAPDTRMMFDAGLMADYTIHPEGYLLNTKSVKAFAVGFVVIFIVAVYLWYKVITGASPSSEDKAPAFIILIPLLLMLSALSRKVIFDIPGQQVKVYHFGLPLFTYPLSEFAGFNIVRKTYNGLYSGTDVRIKFLKQGSKNEKELTLKDFDKTNPIEPFIQETEYVLQQMRKKA